MGKGTASVSLFALMEAWEAVIQGLALLGGACMALGDADFRECIPMNSESPMSIGKALRSTDTGSAIDWTTAPGLGSRGCSKSWLLTEVNASS